MSERYRKRKERDFWIDLKMKAIYQPTINNSRNENEIEYKTRKIELNRRSMKNYGRSMKGNDICIYILIITDNLIRRIKERKPKTKPLICLFQQNH